MFKQIGELRTIAVNVRKMVEIIKFAGFIVCLL